MRGTLLPDSPTIHRACLCLQLTLRYHAPFIVVEIAAASGGEAELPV